jgi:hypothetical protein
MEMTDATDAAKEIGIEDLLPDHVLALVFQGLGARSLMMAGCACRRWKRVADTMELHPTLTVRTITNYQAYTRFQTWLGRSTVAPRVRSVTIKRFFDSPMFREFWYQGLEPLTHLESIRIMFSRVLVPNPVTTPVKYRLPVKLKHLEMRLLSGHIGQVEFHTDFFANQGLHNLTTLKLGFDNYWERVHVKGLDGLPLTCLELVNAPVIAVHTPLSIPSIVMRSTQWISVEMDPGDLNGQTRAALDAENLVLTTKTSRLQPWVIDSLQNATRLQRLVLVSPGHVRLENLHVRVVHLQCDVATVGGTTLPSAREVVVDALHAVALTSTFDPGIQVALKIAGKPTEHPFVYLPCNPSNAHPSNA